MREVAYQADEMKRDDLKQYSGKSVTLILDGKQTSDARLYADNPNEAYVSIAKLAPEWTVAARYTLTDEDVVKLSDSGSGGLIGAIYLKREGDSLIWDNSMPSAK